MAKFGVRTPKGRGKGKERNNENPSKRTEFDTANAGSMRELRQLVEANCNLSLQTARQVRILFGMGVCTSLVPENAAVMAASAVEVEPHSPEGYIFAFRISHFAGGLRTTYKQAECTYHSATPPEAGRVAEWHWWLVTLLQSTL